MNRTIALAGIKSLRTAATIGPLFRPSLFILQTSTGFPAPFPALGKGSGGAGGANRAEEQRVARVVGGRRKALSAPTPGLFPW
jgi:hypothetical protein